MPISDTGTRRSSAGLILAIGNGTVYRPSARPAWRPASRYSNRSSPARALQSPQLADVATLNVTTSAAGAQPRNPCGVIAASHEPSCVRPETVTAVPVGKDARLSPPGEAASIAPPERTTATWPAPAAEPAPLGASGIHLRGRRGSGRRGSCRSHRRRRWRRRECRLGCRRRRRQVNRPVGPAPDGTRSPAMTGSCCGAKHQDIHGRDPARRVVSRTYGHPKTIGGPTERREVLTHL